MPAHIELPIRLRALRRALAEWVGNDDAPLSQATLQRELGHVDGLLERLSEDDSGRYGLAQQALDSYPGGLDEEEAMVDLVSDLRGLAAAKGIDWIKVMDLAELHHEEEQPAPRYTAFGSMIVETGKAAPHHILSPERIVALLNGEDDPHV